MTLAAALDHLSVATDTLADVLAAVRVTVSEDLPDGTPTLAVDELADAAVELAGEAAMLSDRVRGVALGSEEAARSDVRELVVLAQSTLNNISDALADRVLGCEQLAELERAARRGGVPWRSWWSATARGLADCEPAVREVRDQLLVCWRELTETTPAIERLSCPPHTKR